MFQIKNEDPLVNSPCGTKKSVVIVLMGYQMEFGLCDMSIKVYASTVKELRTWIVILKCFNYHIQIKQEN